jgi:hypothetical protein
MTLLNQVSDMNESKPRYERAKADVLLRDDHIWVMITHAADERAPVVIRESHADYPASVAPEELGVSILTALHKSRLLLGAERYGPDAIEQLRGKRSYRAFHRGLGYVGVGYHEGKVHLNGWESDGTGHVTAKKLLKAFPVPVEVKTLGRTMVKFLRASQQLNIPAVGWDRRTAKPL